MTTTVPVPPKKTMRDAALNEVLAMMDRGEKVFFLSADFGAPALDQIRARHADRFINVGIAEQNLINVATGIALEGYTVFAYAIAPFVTMRCCEQIRVNLAILSQVRNMNVNLIGVGAGFSYEVSGPTHHCLEDLSIMRTFPNFRVHSPADWTTAAALVQTVHQHRTPKYLRFDSKPQAQIHSTLTDVDLQRGFVSLQSGREVCFVSTGVMTHRVKDIASRHPEVGQIDLFTVKGFDEEALATELRKYKKIVTVEEGFIEKGGMDAAIGSLVLKRRLPVQVKAMGLKDQYIFHIDSRDGLHAQNDIGPESLIREIQWTQVA